MDIVAARYWVGVCATIIGATGIGAGMATRASAAPGLDGVQTRMTESGADRSGPAMRITTGPSWRGAGTGGAPGFHVA